MPSSARGPALCLLAVAGILHGSATAALSGPLRFEPDPSPGAFVANGLGYQVLASPLAARLRFAGDSPAPGEVSWRFVDATVDATFAPQEPLASRSNYLLGDDPALWRRNVRHFARLRAAGIYPGVDLVLRGDDGQLAFDLELAPGADLAPIRLAWSGQQALRVLPSGAVEVVLAGGTLELSAPVVWEVIGDSRRLLQARFRQVAADTLAFSVDGRDPAARLVIDPTISWATYLGGSGDENALAMATAADGGILIAGLTTSSNFPTASALRPTSGGGTDGFIAKLSADGQDLVFATYLGGSGSDLIKALAVDGSGNIVVAGQTTSSNFPTKSAFQSTRRGSLDAFVTKLTQNGDALVFSTYFGSANCGVCGGLTQANAVTVDGNANVYFTGASFGTSFPGTAGTLKPAFARSCNETNPDFCPGALAGFNVDAFVAKLSPTGSRVYATLLGGNNYTDIANAIDVDSAGNTYVGGYTGAGDFPTTAGAFIGNASSFAAPFVCKLSATASQLVYSTFLDDGRQPALAESIVTDLRVNSAGQVTAVGFTGSSDFPTTAGAIGRPPATPTGRSGFVTRLNATGTGQLASTLLGGQSSSNYVQSLELLPNGSTLVGGRDTTRSVPAIGLPAPTSNGSGYVAELNPGFTALTLAGMIGKTESVDGVAAVGEDVYVAGLTKTAGLATSGALDTSLGGPSDAFVAKISPGPPPTCLPDATHLCLAGDRFRVAVHWSVASQGTSGEGKAVELTGDTGYFWFFSAANVELVLKVLDGRPLNGSWWVFYGALSNVAYTITVTDTTSGAAKTYTNAQGNLASVADTSALPGGATLAAFSLSTGLSATASELAALTALSQAADAEVDAPAPDTAPNRLHRPEAAAAVPIELGQAERRSATAGRVLPLAFTSPFVPATTGNGSPVGSTYEIEAMLAEDTNGDGSGELFHTCPGAGDFVVTFNGTAETLPAYTCAANTTPRVSETFTDHSDGTATVELRLVSTNGADLFPGGLVAGSTPVNGAGLRIGFFAGSDPLDWTPAHKVLAATIDLRANGGSVFAGGASALNVANFFGSPAPWDGNFGIYYAGRAGDGIDEVILKLTVEHDAPPPPPPACVVDDTHLCLAGDRFRVSVAWQTPQGGSGVGHGVELTADTGYFWFFSASNVELVTKILDGRPVNGFWWTFYGALSNVRYTLTVQDTSNGHVKTYTNPQGSLASVADTQSLP